MLRGYFIMYLVPWTVNRPCASPSCWPERAWHIHPYSCLILIFDPMHISFSLSFFFPFPCLSPSFLSTSWTVSAVKHVSTNWSNFSSSAWSLSPICSTRTSRVSQISICCSSFWPIQPSIWGPRVMASNTTPRLFYRIMALMPFQLIFSVILTQHHQVRGTDMR